VRPKLFLSLWYIWCKLCNCLASRLPLSPTGPNELPLEPYYLGVPSGASKMISQPMLPLEQMVYLSYTDTNTISKQTKTRFHMTHVTKDFHQAPPKCFPSLFGANRAPILSQNYYYLQTFQNELPLEPRHIGVPSGASKMISVPMVCLAQTMHLSFTDTNTFCKRTETRFYKNLVT
jgi:hypothetical protein